MNGVKLVEGDDYFALNGSTVVLSSAASLGDSIAVVSYYQFQATGHYTKAESDSRYLSAAATTPLTSFLRTPNYGISSTSDSLSTELTAAAVGQQGVGVKAYGRSMATFGGDLHLIADNRGVGGGHKFYSWNGTSLTNYGGFDSSGRFTSPNSPKFMAYGNNGQISYGNGAEFVLGQTQVNIGGHYNTSNGRFTAPIAGYYHFSYGAYVYQEVQLSFKRNGTDFSPSDTIGLCTVEVSKINGISIGIYLNANDNVSFGYRSGYSGSIYQSHSWFSGFLVG
jgi:hypothetical protein